MERKRQNVFAMRNFLDFWMLK